LTILVQNKPTILFYQSSSIKKRCSLLLLFIFSYFITYSQSESFETSSLEKLQQIEQQIAKEEYEEALITITQLASFKDYIKDDENRLDLDYKKAQCYNGLDKHTEAINILLKGLDEMALKPELSVQKIKYAFYIGKNFRSAKNYNKARAYYKTSLNEAKLQRDTVSTLESFLAIGVTFRIEEQRDSAINYYKKVVGFPINVNTGKIISKIYNNLSGIAMEENNLELAEEYGNTSLEISEQQKDTLETVIALLNLNNIFYKKNEFDIVKKNYLRAYNNVKFLKTKRAFKIKESTLYNLAFVNEELKDFEKAYYYLEDATNLTDSLTEANRIENISEIEAKYNVAKEAQKTEEEKSKLLKTKILFYGSAITFLIIMVLGYIFYRNYRLKQRNKLEQIENEMHTKIINATIDAKEKERKSIAETLHDSVSALLSSANLHLQATKAQLRKDAPKEITKAQSIVNEASVKIRDLSHELISSVLLKFGLAFAVHDMCQKYSNSQISLHSDDNGIKRYEQDFEIKIHNIIEELINNILKHSKASNATIMLVHRADDKLGIRINDDGIGFDMKKAIRKDGLGLSHISARIKVMRGIFTVESSEDEGTNIFILVPIQFKEAVA